MILLAAAQGQTDTSGSIVTGSFTLAAAVVAGGAGLIGGGLLQRWREKADRDAREAARQQVRDEFQRAALQEVHEAAVEWRRVLDEMYSGRTPGMLYSRGPEAWMAFAKVLPRIRSAEVREAANKFRDVSDAALASSPAATQAAARGGPSQVPAVPVPTEVDEAFKALVAVIDRELQGYL